MSIKAIYLPGIADRRPWFQDKILKLWKFFGVEVIYHPVGWAGGEKFEAKLKNVLGLIDKLTANGEKICLIGTSAGAGAALNAYAMRRDKVTAVVFICGKVFGTANINPRYFRLYPAFKESIHLSDTALKNMSQVDKRKMLYVYARMDRTVIPNQNRVAGVAEKTVFALGHISGIYITLLFYASHICRFIKNKHLSTDKNISV